MSTIIFEPNRPQNQSSVPDAILFRQTTDHMASCSIGAILKDLYELRTPRYRAVIDRYVAEQENSILHVKDILNWDSKPLKEALREVWSLLGPATLFKYFGAKKGAILHIYEHCFTLKSRTRVTFTCSETSHH